MNQTDLLDVIRNGKDSTIKKDIEDLIADINDDLDDIGDTDEFDEDYDWDTGYMASSILLRKKLEIILDGKQRDYLK